MSRSPLPEADDGAAAVGEGQQLHVPEVDGVPVGSIQEALEMDSVGSGRESCGWRAAGAEEQMAHELDGAKRA